MSRTIAAPYVTHLAGSVHTRCRMLLVLPRDGTVHAITDHDQDIDFSLPEVPGTVTYRADTGFRISDVEQVINLEPSNYEVTGPVDDSLIVTKAQLLGGRWRRAVCYLFEVNWASPIAAIDLVKGSVVNVHDDGDEFRFEVRDDRDRLNQTVGRGIRNQCERRHAACCVNIAPELDTTVATVPDLIHVEVSDTIVAADFVGGRIWFTTGPLAGNDPVEIFGVIGNILELFEPLVADPVVGSDCTIKEGCDGTIAMCRDRFNNAIEFRGEPAVRGNKIMMPAIPGQGSDGTP